MGIEGLETERELEVQRQRYIKVVLELEREGGKQIYQGVIGLERERERERNRDWGLLGQREREIRGYMFKERHKLGTSGLDR